MICELGMPDKLHFYIFLDFCYLEMVLCLVWVSWGCARWHVGSIQISLVGSRKDSEWLRYIFLKNKVYNSFFLKPPLKPHPFAFIPPSLFHSKLAGNSGAAALRLVAGDRTFDIFFLSQISISQHNKRKCSASFLQTPGNHPS